MSFKDQREFNDFFDGKALALRRMVIDPIMTDQGGIIQDQRKREDVLRGLTPHTFFESVGKGAEFVHLSVAASIADYHRRTGRLPSPDMLGSAMVAMENLAAFSRPGSAGKLGGRMGAIFEDATTETTQGIMMRDRMMMLVLPVMLQTITANMISFIPGTFNQVEIFKMDRVADTTFGDLTKGDVIDWTFSGQYSSMDVIKLAGTGDGTDTGSSDEFEFDSETEFGKVYPFVRKSVFVMHDKDIVAKDDGEGNLHGSFLVGATSVTVTGTVSYDTGNINPVFSVAPASGIKIDVKFDIDIEKDSSLIPSVSDVMSSYTLKPHESAIHAGNTLQAIWAMRREYEIDLGNYNLIRLRNFLAAEKDRIHLSRLYYHSKGEETWSAALPTGAAYTPAQHYESIRETLLAIDQAMLQATGSTGLVGIVTPLGLSIYFKSLPAPLFEPDPNWRSTPFPHRVGRIFGMWDLYCDPQKPDTTTCLCFGKGRDVGDCAYVAGECIPPISFQHPVLRSLRYDHTLWNLSYRDLNRFNGRSYLTNLKITTT